MPSRRQGDTYHGLCYTSCEALVGHWNSSSKFHCHLFEGFAFQLSYITHAHAHTQTNTHTLVTRIYLKHLNLVFSFQPVLHDWCNKGCGMCYPVCGIVHIKEPLLIIGKSLCDGSGFPLSLSEWSFTICPMPYNRK